MNSSNAAPGWSPASAPSPPEGPDSEGLTLRLRLDRLQDLDGAGLREQWRRLCRSEPPRMSRDLLLRAIAYRLQELETGGLPKWVRQSLAGAATGVACADSGAPAPKPTETPRLKPGARLVWEWHGRTHTVIVLDDGFEFEGRRYRSLTQIARELTGAHWSGPKFFGLTKQHSAAGADEGRALLIDAQASSSDGAPRPAEGSADGRRGAEGSDDIEARRNARPVQAEGGRG